MRTRESSDLFRANCMALNRLADPGMATDTKRSLPRMRSHCLRLTRFFLAKPAKISFRACLRWGGSSSVCRTVSTIQPRSTLRVDQQPSPCNIFLRERASRRLSGDTSGRARTLSTAWKRCRRRAFIRRGPPWPSWMKSSTKTSVRPRGLFDGQLDGGAISSGGGMVGIPARARSVAASRVSVGAVAMSLDKSSPTAAVFSRR